VKGRVKQIRSNLNWIPELTGNPPLVLLRLSASLLQQAKFRRRKVSGEELFTFTEALKVLEMFWASSTFSWQQ
jgi:hypothetical protein